MTAPPVAVTGSLPTCLASGGSRTPFWFHTHTHTQLQRMAETFTCIFVYFLIGCLIVIENFRRLRREYPERLDG